jgi:hypothetical protein
MKQKNAKKKTNPTAKSSSTVRKKAKAEAKRAVQKPKITPVKTSIAEMQRRKEQLAILKDPFKGTFNTHDIMHSPVEKTIRMLEKIISGERLFTM